MELKVLSTNFDNNKESNVGRQRKPKRPELLEKKKAIDELIKAACAKKDHLAPFRSLCRFDSNGLLVYLESGSGDKLSSPVKRHLQKILKDNMERHYTHEWATEQKVKRREMVSPQARYIFVYEASHNHEVRDNEMMFDKGSKLVGFLHYQFTMEEEIPVLYLYEIQLESHVQGRGLGKFLMQLIELIAHKNCMSAVILTVQKANLIAMDFYTRKLRYAISSISPSRVDPLMGVEKSYEILCKVFDSEAKAVLEHKTLSHPSRSLTGLRIVTNDNQDSSSSHTESHPQEVAKQHNEIPPRNDQIAVEPQWLDNSGYIEVIDRDGKQHKKRRMITMESLWNMDKNERIFVEVDKYGVPCTKEGAVLASFLGTIATNGELAPLNIPKWNYKEFKPFHQKMLSIIEARFFYPPETISWILKSVNKKWRDYKSDLKAKHFDLSKSIEQIEASVPLDVLSSQWPTLVKGWFSGESQRMSEINTANAKKKRNAHTLGRKSYARRRKEMEQETGKSPDKLTCLEAIHKRKRWDLCGWK